jgi:hypothetical protein
MGQRVELVEPIRAEVDRLADLHRVFMFGDAGWG